MTVDAKEITVHVILRFSVSAFITIQSRRASACSGCQEGNMSKTGKRNAARGAMSVTASILALSVMAQSLVDGFRTDIDKFLGTSSTVVVTDTDENSDPSDNYTYKSDYSSTTELLDSIEDLGERMSEEGTVLLKNNGALPLSSSELNVTLLGFNSYYPVLGGDMGSKVADNEGTDADTVDMVEAFTAKGYSINSTVKDMYEGLSDTFKTESENWGQVDIVYHITAPTTSGYFTSKEPNPSVLDGASSSWRSSVNDYNTIIVTIARAAGENRNYTPGTDGVDPCQNLNQTDPLGLSDDERDLINAAVELKNSTGGKVIVLLNNTSTMEVQEIEDNEGVDAILQIGLPGAYGFYGIADILSGDVNPSGHLSDTYVVTNANSPAAQNYGDLQWTNANAEIMMNDAIVEAEGIYVGYRYYETRYADSVLGQGNADSTVGSSTDGAWKYESEVTYPFGYGLSYTTFEQTLNSVSVDLTNQTVTAEVTVKNTGGAAGKDVVQLYVSVPYTDYDKEHNVEKSAIQLLDYEKTDVLEPGASTTVTITADAQNMASWDSTCDNLAGTEGNYILDAGTYYFTTGNGSHEAMNNVLSAQEKTTADGMTADGNKDNVQTWELSELDHTSFAMTDNGTAVENHLENMDLNYYLEDTVTYLTRSDWEGTWPKTYTDLTATDEMVDILDNDLYEISANGDTSSVTFGANNGLTLADLKGVDDIEDERWDTLMDQITLEECMIRTGFGGTSTKAIESIMSPEAIQNDGPNGFGSYPLGQYANTDSSTGDPCAINENDPNSSYYDNVMCSATVVAQTFSKELAAEYGKALGNYSLWSNLAILWNVSVNIHRLPYNARNHEYFSEDPVLSAAEGTAMVKAGNEYGLIQAVKHFAFNDTEVNRSGVAVFMTEQKARETELRCFQSVIEDGECLGVMTAYNRAGLYAVNAHEGLMMNILRNEWGFKGLMSEDFIMDAGYVMLKEAVQCGVTMSCNTGDNTMQAVSEKYSYWTVENVSQDTQLMTALKQCMKWQNYALANSNAMDGYSSNTRIESVRTWYDNLITGIEIGSGLLLVLSILGYVKSLKKDEEEA